MQPESLKLMNCFKQDVHCLPSTPTLQKHWPTEVEHDWLRLPVTLQLQARVEYQEFIFAQLTILSSLISCNINITRYIHVYIDMSQKKTRSVNLQLNSSFLNNQIY